MKIKLNALEGTLDLVPETWPYIYKLNPLTWCFNLTIEAVKYKQILNYIEWELELYPELVYSSVTWTWSITLNDVVELKKVLAYGNTQQWLLPSWYTQLEYIESTGTQHIVIPYKVSNTDTIKARYMQTATTIETANVPFWVTNSASPTDAKKWFVRTLPWSISLSRVWYWDWDWTVVDLRSPQYANLNTWYSVVYNTDWTIYIDDNLVATLPTSTWTADYDFALFGYGINNPQ